MDVNSDVTPQCFCQPDCDAWYDGGGQRWCVGVDYCTVCANHCTSADETCSSCGDIC